MLNELLARPDLSRLARRLAERHSLIVQPKAESRFAAIALVVRGTASGEPELLMIKRASVEGDPWSGHIACPGGRMDPEDADLEITAIRETREETGVDIARDGKVLGALDDIAPLSPSLPPIIIRPYVAVVRAAVEILPSDEVAEAFWVPLATIHAEDSWGRGVVPIRGVGEREVDVFRHGDYVVWGLTHRALSQFVELLRP